MSLSGRTHLDSRPSIVVLLPYSLSCLQIPNPNLGMPCHLQGAGMYKQLPAGRLAAAATCDFSSRRLNPAAPTWRRMEASQTPPPAPSKEGHMQHHQGDGRAAAAEDMPRDPWTPLGSHTLASMVASGCGLPQGRQATSQNCQWRSQALTSLPTPERQWLPGGKQVAAEDSGWPPQRKLSLAGRWACQRRPILRGVNDSADGSRHASRQLSWELDLSNLCSSRLHPVLAAELAQGCDLPS